MKHVILDRRINDKGKSLTNRKKYLDRIKDKIHKAVRDSIQKGSVKDLISSEGKKITIPGRGLDKPDFRLARKQFNRDMILTGNDSFEQGDRLPKPPDQDQQQGNGGDPTDGEGQTDPFEFSLTKEEFLNIFFEDLALPELLKKQMADAIAEEPKRAGYSIDGSPNKLNARKTMKQSKGRRFALLVPLKKEKELLEKQLLQSQNEQESDKFKEKIAEIDKKIKRIPFIDDNDLRYNRFERFPKPVTKAVMFCVMDVSGSMGEWEKEMAKRFFILLALFLQKNYEKLDIVWVRHTTEAKVVTEDQFFEDRESGGTIVSSALTVVKDLIATKYNASSWNIFISQISDGDNYTDDNPVVKDLLENHLLPITRYYTYVETRKTEKYEYATMFGITQELSELYQLFKSLEPRYSNLKSSIIKDVTDIYPVFRKLFEKNRETNNE